MRIALVIVSTPSMLAGIGIRLNEPVKGIPPDDPINSAIRKIQQLPPSSGSKSA